jgi:hypothetical protein
MLRKCSRRDRQSSRRWRRHLSDHSRRTLDNELICFCPSLRGWALFSFFFWWNDEKTADTTSPDLSITVGSLAYSGAPASGQYTSTIWYFSMKYIIWLPTYDSHWRCIAKNIDSDSCAAGAGPLYVTVTNRGGVATTITWVLSFVGMTLYYVIICNSPLTCFRRDVPECRRYSYFP